MWAEVADGPGWQNRRRLNFNSFVPNDPAAVDLVNDGWTHIPGVCGMIGSGKKIITPENIQEHIEELLEVDRPETDRLRARISRIVNDSKTAEKLKPWYGTWCKRPTFHDDYLPTFNRDNVILIDTNGQGLQAFTANGFTFDDLEYEVDCVVLATGFSSAGRLSNPSTRLGGPIIGRNGVSISDNWYRPKSTAVLGEFLSGFPNLAGTFYSAGGLSYNLTSVYDIFARLFAYVMKESHEQAKDGQKIVIEITQKAEDAWGIEAEKRAAWFAPLAVCTPGYYTAEGTLLAKTPDESQKPRNRHVPWGSGPVEYQQLTEAYIAKEANKLEDFSIILSSD